MSFLQFLISEISQNTFIQFAATITIVVAAIVLLFRIRRKFFLNAGEVFLLSFLGLIAVFGLFSPFPERNLFYRIGLVLGVFVILKTLFGERDIRLLSVVIVLLGICETLYGISRYRSDVLGACGHFDNPAGFASMLIALLPFAVYQVVRRGFLLRILGICAIGIFLTGLVLSKSRAD